MKRKQRRADKLVNKYIRHLPHVALDAPLERRRVYHTVVAHDDCCASFDGKDCNCNPIITRHLEPRRS